MPKLTKRLVDATRPGQTDIFLWDEALSGFGLRIRPSGRRTFVVQYRTRERRTRRRVVGTFSVMTVDQARQVAREWLVEAQRGADPAESLDRNRSAATVADLCEQFLARHADPHKKAVSAAEDRRLIDRYVRPALGQRKAVAVTHDDVERLHRGLKETPYQANRILALLSTVFNKADRELRQIKPEWSSPCRGITRFKEEKRRRYLSGAELARLGRALAEAESECMASPAAIAAIRLLIFTGARRGEILTLTWDQVDLEGRRLRLRDSKTGAKDIHLNPPAIDVLRNIRPAPKNPHVFPGRRPGTHLQEIKSAWYGIRESEVTAALADRVESLCETLLPGGQRVGQQWRCGSLRGGPGAQVRVRLAGARAGSWYDATSLATGGPVDLAKAVRGLKDRAAALAWLREWLGLARGPGLEDVRLRDLRHSFASVGAGAGLSLPIIGALLGHSQPATTARYAHLAADPLQEAVDLVGRRLADALAGGDQAGGKVVPLAHKGEPG